MTKTTMLDRSGLENRILSFQFEENNDNPDHSHFLP